MSGEATRDDEGRGAAGGTISGRVRVTGGCVVAQRLLVAFTWTPGAAAVSLEIEDAWRHRPTRALTASIPLERARAYVGTMTRHMALPSGRSDARPLSTAAGEVTVELPSVTERGFGESAANVLRAVEEPGSPRVTAMLAACFELFDEAASSGRVRREPATPATGRRWSWPVTLAAYFAWVVVVGCLGWTARACGVW